MTTGKPNTFTKTERLCSRKIIEQLFENGQSLFSHPVKLIYIEREAGEKYSPAEAMFVVPKKNFKSAVDRNRLKRQMRESYRLNKNKFYEKCIANNKRFAIAFIYVAKDFTDYKIISNKINRLMNQL